MKRRKGCRMSCGVDEAAEVLENELWRMWSDVRAHSPTFPPLYLHHSSFYNPCVASPKSEALHLLHLASRPCPYDDVSYIHGDFVICNHCGPQDYMKDVNWPSNSKGWRPLLYIVTAPVKAAGAHALSCSSEYFSISLELIGFRYLKIDVLSLLLN